MTRDRFGALLLRVVAVVTLFPVGVSAQSRIAGAVADSSGAVLPGVTVEASSPVLIEKVRSAVTDGRGQYTIIDLRPGSYTLTFTLPGFNTVRREGIQLPADFTATVNAQLSVGAVEETVTVSGQSPLVDVQSAARTQVITRELLDTLPTPRNTQSFGYLAQGVRLSKPDVGGAQMMEQVNMRVHGASEVDTTMQIDGMLVSPAFSDGAIQNYINQQAFAEISFTTSSQSADIQAGGIRQNLIPRDGGNTFSGTNYFGGSLGSWQSNNLTPELIAQGVSLPTGITHIYDINPAAGGPIRRDRLWYYTSMRWMSVNEKVINAYLPDGSQAVVDQLISIPMVRLTVQATPKNKLSAFLDRPFKFKGHEFTFGIEPSRASRRRNPSEANYHNFGTKLTSTVTNRMLLELGFTEIVERLHSGYQPDVFPSTQGYPRPANIHLLTGGPNVDPWFTGVQHYEILSGEATEATTGYSGTLPDRRHIETALSYVTGSHSLKTGFQWSWGQDRNDAVSNGDLQRKNYRNGVPESVVVTINPFATEEYVKADIGLYVMDTWTLKRLTLTPGVRYDYFNSMIKEQWRQEGRFVPGQIVPEIDGLPIWHDISPRFSLAYDVFGTGRTALKFAVNKYVRPYAGSFAKRYNPLRGTSTDTRDWFDCVLLEATSTCDPAQIGGSTYHDDIVQDNEIGPSNNLGFGKAANIRPADGIKRPYNVEVSAAVQHQLLPNVSITGAWYRRKYYRLIAADNVLLDPQRDYATFQVANPIGNGETLTIYNLDPAKRGQVEIVDYNSSRNTHISNDLELSFNSRLPNGSTVFGGWSASRNVENTCDAENPNGENFADLFYSITFLKGGRFCDERQLDIPFRHDFKFAGTLPVVYGVVLSGTVTSFAGNESQVVWNVPASVFPGGKRTQTTNVRLTAPGTRYLPRWNQVDFSVKKNFRTGHYQFSLQADLYNLLNSAVVTTETQTYGPSLGFPNTILQGRLPRVAAQVSW